MAVKESERLAQIIRRERRERGWTQEQLADAAGVNYRTVQRVENGSACSGETLQALAGAMGIDVRELVAALPCKEGRRSLLNLTASQTSWASAVLTLPGMIFVVMNVAYYELGFSHAAPIINSASWNALSSHPFSPVVLLGGPVLSLMLGLPYLIGFRTRKVSDATIIESIALVSRKSHWIVTCGALATLSIMLLYGLFESIGHMIAVT